MKIAVTKNLDMNLFATNDISIMEHISVTGFLQE